MQRLVESRVYGAFRHQSAAGQGKTAAVNILGKLIGALLGLLLFRHPIGIVLGGFFGHLWDIGALRPQHQGPPNSFILPLFSLAGAIAKSDGRVSEQEIAATENLMVRMQLSPDQRASAIEGFAAGKQPGFAVHLTIADLKAWAGGRRDLAFLLLDMLLDIVYAEGPLAPNKFVLVRKLCWSLGVDERELAALAAMRGHAYAARDGAAFGHGYGRRYGHAGSANDRYEQAANDARRRPADKDSYAVLGLGRDANEREIKRAYRKLISQHHPDKLGDVPAELKRRAEERAREINAAYERIREERGIK
jgi:DnaJ like chaperone protein